MPQRWGAGLASAWHKPCTSKAPLSFAVLHVGSLTANIDRLLIEREAGERLLVVQDGKAC